MFRWLRRVWLISKLRFTKRSGDGPMWLSSWRKQATRLRPPTSSRSSPTSQSGLPRLPPKHSVSSITRTPFRTSFPSSAIPPGQSGTVPQSHWGHLGGPHRTPMPRFVGTWPPANTRKPARWDRRPRRRCFPVILCRTSTAGTGYSPSTRKRLLPPSRERGPPKLPAEPSARLSSVWSVTSTVPRSRGQLWWYQGVLLPRPRATLQRGRADPSRASRKWASGPGVASRLQSRVQRSAGNWRAISALRPLLAALYQFPCDQVVAVLDATVPAWCGRSHCSCSDRCVGRGTDGE